MKINAAVIQYHVQIGQIERNMQRAEELLHQAAAAGAELLLLPEVFCTGFDMQNVAKIAQDSRGEAVTMLQQVAKQHNVHIIGGSIIEKHKKGGYYNTCFVLDGKGRIVTKYRKVHLFPIPAQAAEKAALSRGDELSLFDIEKEGKALRVGLGICYDIRFPEQFRNLALRGADIIALPANWVESRRQELISMCRSRACENVCHLMMANSTSPEGKRYSGDSMIVSPLAEQLAYAGREEGFFMAEIDTDYAENNGWFDTIESRVPFIDEIDNNLL